MVSPAFTKLMSKAIDEWEKLKIYHIHEHPYLNHQIDVVDRILCELIVDFNYTTGFVDDFDDIVHQNFGGMEIKRIKKDNTLLTFGKFEFSEN